ncbi:bifunctional molybdopterin adenylyltransferase MobB/molybdopterin molybdotransferase MoeA family protein [Sporobolomyces koalae]|uniref:bifunctional molybdopterin adenylyltransferase MobB/molybdopterin molybdotransferase MoeA family protein n=1 Tax=Sporobolomyces koalae TaxID=500713 RepID=UPI003170E91B
MFTVALLIVSDTASADPASDRVLPLISDLLVSTGVYSIESTKIVPDEPQEIKSALETWIDQGVQLCLTSGGTGFGTRDCTPEAVATLIDKPAPGLVAAMLLGSLNITPLAALSRPVAGIALPRCRAALDAAGAGSLLVTLPGSPKGAKENLETLLKVLPHALELARGDHGRTTRVHKNIEQGRDGMDENESIRGASVQGQHPHDQAHAHSHTCGGSHTHSRSHSHSHSHGHHAPRSRTLMSQDPSIAIASRQRQSPWPLVSVPDALALVFEHTPVLPVETVTVDENLVGHVLADDVCSPKPIPNSPSTNIDGYAVRSTDAPGVYKVVTTFPKVPLEAGSVYRINTGAPLPPGMDACIMVEDTQVVSRDEHGEEVEVRLLAQVDPGENVRKEGSDVRQGEKVLEQGDVISHVGGELGTLAFVGKRSVAAHRRPIVAVLSTGNELIDLQDVSSTTTSSFSAIVDSNRPTLLSILQHHRFETLDLGICTDSMAATKAALKKGVEEADLVITTGGTSMGVSDLLKPCIERELGGSVKFGRVAMKPGKPTTFATIPAHPFAPSRNPKLVFALPGNPASALVTFYLFVMPALRKMEGRRQGEWELPRVPVTLTSTVRLDSRAEYQRVLVRATRTGLEAVSTGGQRSSRTVSLAGANGLLELPAQTDAEAEKRSGETVSCVLIGDVAVHL